MVIKLTRTRAVRAGQVAYALLLSTILAFSYWIQSQTFLNHDVSWVLYSSREMLHGARFGADIVAANPPLVWWVSLLPNIAAIWLNSSLIPTFRLFIMALTVTSLWASDRLLARGERATSQRRAVILVACYFLAFAVGRDFGQREQLSVLLVLPYLMLLAARLEGATSPTSNATLIGVCAGIGVAFKPYFLLVPALVELHFLVHTKTWRSLIRPEIVGAAVAIMAYAGAVLLFADAWLFDALPRIARVYWAFEQPINGMIPALVLKFGPPSIILILILFRKADSLSILLALAAAGFFGAALAQGKFYSYHLFPAYSLLLLAVTAATFSPASKRSQKLAGGALLLALALFDIPKDVSGLLARRPDGSVGSEIAETSAYVANAVPMGGSFLAISTHPFPGFPTALYADRHWASESNSRIFLPAVVRLREAGSQADPTLRKFAEREAWDDMLRDLARKPDVILVDRRPYRHAIGASQFDFVSFYLEEPRIRQAWASYSEAAASPKGFDVYRRRKGRDK